MTIAALRCLMESRPEDGPIFLHSTDGHVVLRLERKPAGTQVTVMEQALPGLSDFLLERLPSLLAEFQATRPEDAVQEGRG